MKSAQLPLDVQAKLLRFVQEKELIAVGDTRRRSIDTRIICATNRDLLFESSQGRFRSDLYYRLQVLQVTVPPLRERTDDIAALANSFLARYRDQFGRELQGFTDAAWEKMVGYNWPGNVRELQNAIVRATLTTESDYIDAQDLQFGEELPTPENSVLTDPAQRFGQPRPPQRGHSHTAPLGDNLPAPTAGLDRSIAAVDETASSTDDWATLASLLNGQVAALIQEQRMEAPLGRWLADTVVLTAARVSNGVARQAARLLGHSGDNPTTAAEQSTPERRQPVSAHVSTVADKHCPPSLTCCRT